MHRKIDICVNADELALMRFGASVFIVGGEKTFHPRNTAAEKTGRGPVAQMCERIVDKNINRAGDNIVGRGTELAFAADDLAFAKSVLDGRALPQFSSCARGISFSAGRYSSS